MREVQFFMWNGSYINLQYRRRQYPRMHLSYGARKQLSVWLKPTVQLQRLALIIIIWITNNMFIAWIQWMEKRAGQQY